MPQLFRAFLLKEVYDWDHETAVVDYLRQHSENPSLARVRYHPRSVDTLAELEQALQCRPL